MNIHYVYKDQWNAGPDKLIRNQCQSRAQHYEVVNTFACASFSKNVYNVYVLLFYMKLYITMECILPFRITQLYLKWEKVVMSHVVTMWLTILIKMVPFSPWPYFDVLYDIVVYHSNIFLSENT